MQDYFHLNWYDPFKVKFNGTIKWKVHRWFPTTDTSQVSVIQHLTNAMVTGLLRNIQNGVLEIVQIHSFCISLAGATAIFHITVWPAWQRNKFIQQLWPEHPGKAHYATEILLQNCRFTFFHRDQVITLSKLSTQFRFVDLVLYLSVKAVCRILQFAKMLLQVACKSALVPAENTI